MLSAAAALMAVAAAPSPFGPASWPADVAARREAESLLQTLNADLLNHDSATLTLERWCAARGLAEPARVVARRVPGVEAPVSTAQRRALAVDAVEPVRHRRVQLMCGGRVLSEADNWYVPARLTAEMNHALETSDVAFGRVVQTLHFHRRVLSAEVLWRPLSAEPGARRLAIPAHVLRQSALLLLPDGTPFSEVVESYTAAVFAQGPPGADPAP